MSNTLSIKRSGLLPDLELIPVPGLAVIFGLLALRTLLFLALDGVLYTVAPGAWPYSQLWLNALLIIPDLITITIVLLVLGRVPIPRPRPADLGWGLLMTLIVMIGFVASSYVGNLIAYGGAPPSPSLPDGFGVPLEIGILAMITPLTIGIAERLVYGVCQDWLTRRWGTAAAVVVVALFFAAQHVPLVIGMGSQAVIAKVVGTFLTGLLFGALLVWRRRLTPLIIAHVILDLIGLGLPTLALSLGS